MEFLVIFLPAVLCTLFFRFYWHTGITSKESLFSLGANIFTTLIFAGMLAGYGYSQMYDSAVISGQVTGKERNVVSCSHSYSCNCYTTCSGSGSSRSCTQHCSTCYDHSFDVDWDVYTTLGTYTISREDRQGLDEPARWSVVRTGEPVADTDSYMNYLLASPNSLFVEMDLGSKAYENMVPAYPQIFDYWKINRIVSDGVPYQAEIGTYINERLKTLGPAKQLNVIVVITKKPKAFYQALMANWKGGKKNDVIMVYGLDTDDKVSWFKANSYAMGQGNIEMLMHLEEIALDKQLDVSLVSTQLDVIEKKFQRLPASEFEFKAKDIEIPMGFVVFLMLLNLATSFFISRHMHKEDFFAVNNTRQTFNYRRKF